jgi:hypothetical protein
MKRSGIKGKDIAVAFLERKNGIGFIEMKLVASRDRLFVWQWPCDVLEVFSGQPFPSFNRRGSAVVTLPPLYSRMPSPCPHPS